MKPPRAPAMVICPFCELTGAPPGHDRVVAGNRHATAVLDGYQQATGTRARRYQRPATLRSSVFLGGAILGKRSRRPVLFIAQSWGGAHKHQPLIDKVLQWRKRTSPKSNPDDPSPPPDAVKFAA